MKIKLKNLIYLTIFLLPVYLIRFSWLGLPTNLLEAIISLIFILWFFKYYHIFWEKSFWLKQRKYLLPISLILGGLFLSLLFNPNYLRGLGIIKAWFVFPIIFAFMVFQIIKAEERKNIFKAFYLSALAISFIGLIYFFGGQMTYDGRLQALFNSPNYLAMYLAPAIIMGAIFFQENRKIYGISLAIILSTFYLTLSYAAWMAVLLALFITLWLNKKLSRKWLWLPLILLAVFIFFQSGTKKMSDFLQKDPRSSISSREMIWSASKKILADHWFLGIGPGNFQDKYLEYQRYFPPYLEWAVPQPHSLYLAFWLQSGLVGFLGFILLIFRWFKNIFQRPADNLKWISLGIMLYILIHGLVDTTYFKNDLAIIFWLTFLAI